MKKIYLLFLFPIYAGFTANAATIIIEVINNQFNPANTTVVVGDIVRYHFVEGFHNAISSGAAIPTGAAEINSGGPNSQVRDYDYVVGVPGEYNYYCEVHGDPSGGMNGMFMATGPLPVKLSGFEVHAQPDKFPILRWSTLTELNVSHFLVQSSYDGVRFHEVARVAATGNSTTEQHYQFKDQKLSAAYRYVYYQLAIVDKDGKETYSPIRQFKTDFAANKLLVQIGPNPIKKPGQLMLQFNAESSGVMPVNVFDANGRLVLKTSLRAVPGLNNGHVHVCDFAPGMYTLQFAFEGKKETKRIIVQ